MDNKCENTRCSWSKAETMLLLAAMKKNHVMALLNGKTRRNQKAYMLLSKELAIKGFSKSREQVKLKFRTLKMQYLRIKRQIAESGAAQEQMEHFKAMEDLLEGHDECIEKELATIVPVDMLFDEFEAEEEKLFEEQSDEIKLEEEYLLEEEPKEITLQKETLEEFIEQEPDEELDDTEFAPKDMQQNNGRKRKSAAVQKTLLNIAADIRHAQKATIKMLKELDDAFLAKQRILQVEFLEETKMLMAEDRNETKKMLLEILNN